MKYQIEIKPTYSCNNTCNFCIFSKRKKWQMNNAQINKSLNVIKNISKKYDIKCLILSGGEPTIHPLFNNICKYIIYNIKPSIFSLHTNARLFSDQFNNKYLKSLEGRKIEVFVSLHGSSKNHNSITNNIFSFDQTISGIKNLIKNNHDVHLTSNLTEEVLLELNNFSSIVNQLEGLKTLNLRFLFPTDNNLYKNINFDENFKNIKKFIGKINIPVFFSGTPHCFLNNIVKHKPKLLNRNYLLFDFRYSGDNYHKDKSQIDALVPGLYDLYKFNKKCNSCSKEKVCAGMPPILYNNNFENNPIQ